MNKMIRPVLLALTIGIAAPGVAMARGGDDDRDGRHYRQQHDHRHDRHDRRHDRHDNRHDRHYRHHHRAPVVVYQPAPRVVYRQTAPRVVYEPVYMPPPRPVYVEPGVSVRINLPITF